MQNHNSHVFIRDAHVFVFDIFGKQLLQFGFVEEVKNAGILKIKHWETGVAILTKDFKIWVVSDLDAPFCEQFAPMSMYFSTK